MTLATDRNLLPADSHPLPKSLGGWIAELRLAKRKLRGGRRSARFAPDTVRPWARADLAGWAGISEATLFRIETSQDAPRYDVLESLMTALDVFPWQAQLLRDMWLGRASATRLTVDTAEARQAAVRLLEEIPFPAYVQDGLYFIKARNRYMPSVVGLAPDSSGLWETPNTIVLQFHPDVSINWLEPDAAARARRLREFLLKTARYAADPVYTVLLDQLEDLLNRHHRGWQAVLHADETMETPSQRLTYRHPEIGPLELLVFEQQLKVGQTYTVRINVPTVTSAAAFERLKALADQDANAVYVCPAWRALDTG